MFKKTRIFDALGRIGVLMLTFSLLALGPSSAKESSTVECNLETQMPPRVSLAALYRQNLEFSYLKGICEALKKHKLGPVIKVEKFPYGNDDTAFEILSDLLTRKTTNIVLGPTDSGVFLRAIREFGDKNVTPIVSPLVAADYDFNPNKLIFSTNVNLKKRTRTLANTLAKLGLRSIVVLHSNSKYGLETEAAFREALEPDSQYRPLQYDSDNFSDDGPYQQIKQVLLDRPEGLGIFGSRDEVQAIAKLLSEMNSSLTSYRPIMFTPIDFRPHNFQDYVMYSVSLDLSSFSKDQTVLTGDVEGLTHDTVLLLLDQLATGSLELNHRHLMDVFSGARSIVSPTLTGMKFTQGRNASNVRILRRDPDGKVDPVFPPTLFDIIKLKVTLLFNTRGWWVIASLFIICIIPIFLSILDMKSWFRGSLWELLRSPTVWGFIMFNFFIVGALYFYLAETGRVPYDSPLTALIIAMGPTTLLKSTFFNTETGKAIGLSSLYGSSMKWLNRQLMTKKYRAHQKYINILSYYNSLAGLRDELIQVYSNARSAEEKVRLTTQLDEDIFRAETHLEKRIVCARRLYEEFKWDELKEFIPAEYDKDDPQDPDSMIRYAVKHVRSLTQKEQDKIMEPVRDQANKLIDERYKGEKVNFQSEKQNRVYHCVRFLVQYCFFKKEQLIAANLLPKNWGEESFDLEEPKPPKEKPEDNSKKADLVVQLTGKGKDITVK